MAYGTYVGVGGTARKVASMYTGVGGAARKVSNGYTGVGGTARKFYSASPNIEEPTVGETGYYFAGVYWTVLYHRTSYMALDGTIHECDHYALLYNGYLSPSERYHYSAKSVWKPTYGIPDSLSAWRGTTFANYSYELSLCFGFDGTTSTSTEQTRVVMFPFLLARVSTMRNNLKTWYNAVFPNSSNDISLWAYLTDSEFSDANYKDTYLTVNSSTVSITSDVTPGSVNAYVVPFVFLDYDAVNKQAIK